MSLRWPSAASFPCLWDTLAGLYRSLGLDLRRGAIRRVNFVDLSAPVCLPTAVGDLSVLDVPLDRCFAVLGYVWAASSACVPLPLVSDSISWIWVDFPGLLGMTEN